MAEGLDLLELGEDGLYFDEPCAPEVEALIAQAAASKKCKNHQSNFSRKNTVSN